MNQLDMKENPNLDENSKPKIKSLLKSEDYANKLIALQLLKQFSYSNITSHEDLTILLRWLHNDLYIRSNG